LETVVEIIELCMFLYISTVFDDRLNFAHADDIYSLMENIVTVAVPEVQVPDNNGISTTYPSLNRFSPFFPFISM